VVTQVTLDSLGLLVTVVFLGQVATRDSLAHQDILVLVVTLVLVEVESVVIPASLVIRGSVAIQASVARVATQDFLGPADIQDLVGHLGIVAFPAIRGSQG
jgi:hypothetical protein